MKLKDTLRLPRTEFPMKGALPLREPERIAAWERADLHGQLRARRAGAPKYVLHDGPPYANGHVHIGTALNKIIKDFVVRARSQAGFDAPYVPGWDCHGMPIEHAVLKQAREEKLALSPEDVRTRCRAFAESFVDIQRAEFRRLGVMGQWDQPYLTMERRYQATIVRSFARLWEQGAIYKGLRPIHWCPTCVTALANAEVEYDPDHVSTAVHVRFATVASEKSRALGLPDGSAFLAWTTTPWTLPANVALAVHPDATYVLAGGDAGGVVVMEALLAATAGQLGWKDAPVLARLAGRDLAGVVTRHPLFDRDSVVVTALHVTTETGTGVVHTAPGHGAEDFETGREHGLPTIIPVGKDGRFNAEAGPYAGQHVFEAGPAIVKDLQAAGALAGSGRVTHKYPSCWRCHGPLIFLATEQWFWNVEHDDLRARCLEQVERVTWTPGWGRDRMRDAVKTRPDWCLSRQRTWGVPVPALACTGCGEAFLSAELLASAGALVAEGGVEAWLATPAAELVPAGTACGRCGGTSFEKDPNILDVWFDSSCSQEAVLQSGRWPDLRWPADLYLEGVDQHRGWFQVSLLTGVALHGAAPFGGVFTHGLILDDRGRKMSKSLGNVVAPEDVLTTQGADVLRLFFASVDCTSDIKFSRSLLEPVSEGYRKIRNTLRFLLGNLADFDPETDAVAEDRMLELDRFALARLRETSAQARAEWEALDFHSVQRLMHGYLSSDVSAFFAHVTKDRLYCDEPGGLRRRSAQTVLFEIARETCQLLAPILCFTMDEAWEHLPAWRDKPASVHLASWRDLGAADASLLATWADLLALRDDALKALEVARASGLIGDPLEAAVTLVLDGALRATVEPRLAAVAEMLVVSSVTLAPNGSPPPDAAAKGETAGTFVLVERATGAKCPRCWMRRADAGGLASHPDACGRCAAVVSALGVTIDPS